MVETSTSVEKYQKQLVGEDTNNREGSLKLYAPNSH